jgi:hypothetical protein
MSESRPPPPREPLTPLAQQLLSMIRARGPLTLPEFMTACLADPAHGDYTRAARADDKIGERGDFVTSPEISQIFGEMVFVWLNHCWEGLLVDIIIPTTITHRHQHHHHHDRHYHHHHITISSYHHHHHHHHHRRHHDHQCYVASISSSKYR